MPHRSRCCFNQQALAVSSRDCQTSKCLSSSSSHYLQIPYPFSLCLMFCPTSYIRAFGFLRYGHTWIVSPTALHSRSLVTLADINVKRVWRSQRTPISPIPFRGAKTRTSVHFNDLPQGAIPLDAPPFENDGPPYPTVVLQARSNMQKFESCVLLTRVGGFYELYFEHAEEFGPLLNL